MAERKPLVRISGKTKELPAGDTLPASAVLGGGGGLSGFATITLPGGRGVMDWEETVPAVGVAPANRVFVALGPTLDEDENHPMFVDLVQLAAVPGTDEITVLASFSTLTSGPLKLIWSAF